MTLYYISHFLQTWLIPPGFNLLLALVGFLLIKNHLFLGKSLMVLSFLSLWLLSTPSISFLLINGLQNKFPPLQIQPEEKLIKNAAIIVLGGGNVHAREYENKQVTNRITLNRLRYAVYLYQKTNFPIIVSGGRLEESESTEADIMQDDLSVYFKTPIIDKEDKSITTRDEAKLILPILKKDKIQTVYIVTDTWHMPRAMRVFQMVLKNTDIKLVAAPVGYTSLNLHQKFFNYLPSLGGLNTSATAIHEYIGMIAYAIADWRSRIMS